MPLPIGEGKTISQPYIVANITQELKVAASHKELEVGTMISERQFQALKNGFRLLSVRGLDFAFDLHAQAVHRPADD